MNYGKTIRSIRISKGLSQKEVYTGIVSKSFAINFEKGQHMLNYTDFMNVLEHIHVSHDEFVFIHNNYHRESSDSLWMQFAIAANNRDNDKLRKLYEYYKQSKNKYEILIAYTSNALRNYLFVEKELPKNEAKFLQDYIVDKETWTLDEINLFTSFYYVFDSQSQSTFMKICFEKLKKYIEYPNYLERVYNLLTNYIQYCYMNKRVSEADEWMVEVKLLPKDRRYLLQLNIARYCEGIQFIVHNDLKRGKQLAKQCFELFRFLQLPALEADSLEKGFKDMIKLYSTS